MHSFRNNNYNSKSTQHVENGHPKETTRIIKILCQSTKDPHLDTIEKFYIYKETKKGNALNNKHSWPHCNL